MRVIRVLYCTFENEVINHHIYTTRLDQDIIEQDGVGFLIWVRKARWYYSSQAGVSVVQGPRVAGQLSNQVLFSFYDLLTGSSDVELWTLLPVMNCSKDRLLLHPRESR